MNFDCPGGIKKLTFSVSIEGTQRSLLIRRNEDKSKRIEITVGLCLKLELSLY